MPSIPVYCSKEVENMNTLSTYIEGKAKMDTHIEEYILQATIKCKNGFSCLDGKKDCICKIVPFDGHHTVQIEGRPVKTCNYILNIGSKLYCLCPVRNELYNRHKI